MVNNCGYCLRSWRKLVTESNISLEIKKITADTINGENGFFVDIHLIGYKLPANIYNECYSTLKIHIGMYQDQTFLRFSGYLLWIRETQESINEATYEFKTWVSGTESQLMMTLNFPNNYLIMYYRVVIGVDIYEHNYKTCGVTAVTQPDIIATYKYCKSFKNGVCQCFPLMVPVKYPYTECTEMVEPEYYWKGGFQNCIEKKDTNQIMTYCELCVPGYKLVMPHSFQFGHMRPFCKNVPNDCPENCYMCGCTGGCNEICGHFIFTPNKCTTICLVCNEGFWPVPDLSGSTTNICSNTSGDTTLKKADCKYHRISGECYQCIDYFVLSYDKTTCAYPTYVFPERLYNCRVYEDTNHDSCYECKADYYQLDTVRNSYCYFAQYPLNFVLATKYLIGFAKLDWLRFNIPAQQLSYDLTALIEATPANLTCNGCNIEQGLDFVYNNATYFKLCWTEDCSQQLVSFRVNHDSIVYAQFAALIYQNIWNTTNPLSNALCYNVDSSSLEIQWNQAQCLVTETVYGSGIKGFLAKLNFTEISKRPGIPAKVDFKQLIPYLSGDVTLKNQEIFFTLVIQGDFKVWTQNDWWNFYGGFVTVMNFIIPLVVTLMMFCVCGISIRNLYQKLQLGL